MFERHSDRSFDVVIKAVDWARRLGLNTVSTEHFLPALLIEGDGKAALALSYCNVRLDSAIQAVIDESVVGTSIPKEPIRYSATTRKVLELAYTEAIRLGSPTVEPEHILLALTLVEDEDGDLGAVRVLSSLEVQMGEVRDTLLKLMSNKDNKTAAAH